MTRRTKRTYSFASGAWSTAALGNSHLQGYDSAAAVMENVRVASTGTAMTRKGVDNLEIITAAQSGLLLPRNGFKVYSCRDSENTDHILLFYIENTAIAIMEITANDLQIPFRGSIFLQSENKDPKLLSITQILDTVIFTHPSMEMPLSYILGSHSTPQPLEIETENSIFIDGRDNNFGNFTAVAFHAGRLVLAKADKVYFSRANDYYNFTENRLPETNGVPGEVLDDSAAVTELTGQNANNVRELFSYIGLYVFTDSGVFYNNERSLTPRNLIFNQVNEVRGAYINPVIVQSELIYVRQPDTDIKASLFDLERAQDISLTGRFIERNLSQFSDHLIKVPIDMVYIQGSADNSADHIYVLNDDGTIAVLTINREQELRAWSSFSFNFGSAPSGAPYKVIGLGQREGELILITDKPSQATASLPFSILRESATAQEDFEWVIETAPPELPEREADLNSVNYRLLRAYVRLVEANNEIKVDDVAYSVNNSAAGGENVQKQLQVQLNRPWEQTQNTSFGLRRGIKISGSGRNRTEISNIALEIMIGA